jgi:hypothetical protein
MMNARIAMAWLLLAASAMTWRAAAATNAFVFNPTTLSAGSAGAGPITPANGSVSINGTSLTAGDVIVFDGTVANVNGATGDNWGSINFNPGGFVGLTGARFGVLVRTGTGALQCQVYTNGVAGAAFPGTSEIRTNRVLISLFVATTGSTTNLGYRVQIDQGLTGAFTSTLTGTNVTFPGNSIALTFSAYSVSSVTEFFAPTVKGLHLQLPHTNLLAGAADQSVVTVDYLGATNVALTYNPGLVYSSSDTNVVTISNQGLLQAKVDGTATVGVAYATFSDSKTLTVTTNPGALTAVRLIVTNQMRVNATQQAAVRGDFENVTDVDILSYGQPTFAPGNSNILSVSDSGLIAAIAPGSTTVLASYGGLASSKTITTTFPTNRFIFDTFGDGFWTISNSLNGKVLVVGANSASQATFTNGATDQHFELLYNLQNSTFRLRNRANWFCIGTKNSGTAAGTAVATITYSGTASQQWYLVDAGNGFYRIINRASNLALQTDNGNPAAVTIAPASTNAAQLWAFSYQTHFPKKGCAGYEGNYAQFGLNWAYNYNDNTGTVLPPSVNYTPMIYAAHDWQPLSDAQARAPGWQASAPPTFLLAYNEPDNSGANGGSDRSTNDAIAIWPQIQNLNVPIVSPACATTYGSWMYNFFSLIATNNYRVDYTAAHMYQPPNASSLIGNLQNVYSTWGRPVWLTEFSPVDWSNTQSWSEQDNFNFLAEFMWLAEDNVWFKRYSIFPFSGTPSANPWDVNGHRGDFFLADGATLTPYGELYATWDANRTVQTRTPYLIHNLATSFRLTATNSSSAPQPQSIRVRDASAQWALLPAVTANRYHIISLKDGRRLRNNGGTPNLAPVGTTGSAVEWWFNGPDSKGYYYIDNTSAAQSIRATGTAPAISLSMINNPAPSTATQWRLVKPYQPVTIITAAPPIVSITYSNSSARLAWSGNGSFYNVYRATTSGGIYTKIVTATTNSSYLDTPLQNGTAYFYVVTALNILGEESANSAEVVARPASMSVVPVGFATITNGLLFDWPPDHIGWRLMMNTNDLGNSGAWFPVANSAATNQVWLPFDATPGNVFFRLIYP